MLWKLAPKCYRHDPNSAHVFKYWYIGLLLETLLVNLANVIHHSIRTKCSLAEAVGDSDPDYIPAEPYLHQPGWRDYNLSRIISRTNDRPSPIASNDRMGLHQDGTTSSRTCDETERDSAPLGVTSTCARILPSPSPDSMGIVRRTDNLVTNTKTKPFAGVQRYGYWDGSDSGNPNDGQATQASI